MNFRFRDNKRSPRSIRVVICLCFLLMISFCGLISLDALAQEAFQTDQVILTWTKDPAATQDITWMMPDNLPAYVQYIKATEYQEDFALAAETIASAIPFNNGQYRYSVTITGLNPDTQYVYRVGRDGAWSEPLSFSTGPIDPESFTFLYLGDVQSEYPQWGSLLEKIYMENPEIKFSLLGGDLTNNGDDENEWGEFLDAATGLFSRIPMMPTMGNHDGSMYLKFFSLPDNGPLGLKQEFYSFDYGDAHFVVLNSRNNTDLTVRQWLEEDLQNTAKKWKFAVFHHPAYPAVADYKGIDESIRENWIPILEDYNIDMVFVGHQHVYMRTKPIRDDQIQPEGQGIVYIMGNSGTKYYSLGTGFDYIAEQLAGISNYQLINIDGNMLTMTARDANGQIIDRCTMTKQPLGGRSQYTVTPLADVTYQTGVTPDGICTMTVGTGIFGMKYFGVQVAPVTAHEGIESLVFTHWRNGVQIGINVTKADFDIVDKAQTGFNVQPGDIVRVYMVDDLTNGVDCNPRMLQ